MDLTYLRTFREVARTKNITKAAVELGYAQSSVTTQIQKLEREYGVPLLERYGRRLRHEPGRKRSPYQHINKKDRIICCI